MEKFFINGEQVQPEEIRVIWIDAFGHDNDGDIMDWRRSEIEDSWLTSWNLYIIHVNYNESFLKCTFKL